MGFFFSPSAGLESQPRPYLPLAGEASADLKTLDTSPLTLCAFLIPVFPPSRPTGEHFTPRRVSTSTAESGMAPLCACVGALHGVSTPLSFFEDMNESCLLSRSHLSVSAG